MTSNLDPDAAHKHCGLNREEIERSTSCGCFYCRRTFLPSEIEDWTDEHAITGPGGARSTRGLTALCPRCGIDSVLGSASGLPVAEPGFLERMHNRWFS